MHASAAMRLANMGAGPEARNGETLTETSASQRVDSVEPLSRSPPIFPSLEPIRIREDTEMMRSIVVLALAVGAGQLAPTPAHAQLLKKIRNQVEQKVEAAKARADSAALARASQTVDS